MCEPLGQLRQRHHLCVVEFEVDLLHRSPPCSTIADWAAASAGQSVADIERMRLKSHELTQDLVSDAASAPHVRCSTVQLMRMKLIEVIRAIGLAP